MINWRYIKGMNQAGTGVGTEEQAEAESGQLETLYTFLYFKRKSSTAFPAFEFVPGIAINDANSFDKENNHDFGHIITQKATNQHIDTAFTFINSLIIRDSNSTISIKENSLHCEREARFFNDVFSIRDEDPSFTLEQSDNNQIRLHLYGDNGGTLGFNFNSTSTNPFEFTSDGHFHTTGYITAIGKCEAQYFNATSDRRAKDNLKILNFKALDLINHTNLYSFTYKDTNTPSIGIIAQDVQNVNIEGFKLVDNENATGKDMDYMSIHESKLIYILWQAIKEQQKEIEELKKRLE